MLMLTAGEVMQEVVEHYNKLAADTIAVGIARAQAIQDGYNKLKIQGVKSIPDKLTAYELKYGFKVDVAEPNEWGKIHRAMGKLELYDKSPVDSGEKKKGRKPQMIRLILSPKGELRYHIQFRVERKLTKSDKCQVKVVTSKSLQVVCSV